VSEQVLRWRPQPPFVAEGSTILTHDAGTVLLHLDDPAAAEALLAAWDAGMTADEGEDWFLARGAAAMAEWLHLFDVLTHSGRLSPSIAGPDGTLVRLLRHPGDSGAYSGVPDPGDDALVLGTGVIVTRQADRWRLESPQGRAVADVDDNVMQAVVHADSSARVMSMPRALLREAGILVHAESTDRPDRSIDVWEPHDRYFHWRTRRGGNPYVVGATYPLRDRMPPLPVSDVPAHDLEFDIAAYASPEEEVLGMSVAEAMHARASTRQSPSPMTLGQLADFCVAHRVTSTRHMSHDVEYPQSRRLYPGGGASYEIDLILTTRGVGDLPAGVWWLDAERVVLCRLAGDLDHVEALFADAMVSTGGVGEIQVLVTYALRMGRNSWKYEGMAYRLALLDAGVLYGHAYLVAAALGIGICGLGNGDSAALARVTEAELVSVAEVMLTGAR